MKRKVRISCCLNSKTLDFENNNGASTQDAVCGQMKFQKENTGKEERNIIRKVSSTKRHGFPH